MPNKGKPRGAHSEASGLIQTLERAILQRLLGDSGGTVSGGGMRGGASQRANQPNQQLRTNNASNQGGGGQAQNGKRAQTRKNEWTCQQCGFETNRPKNGNCWRCNVPRGATTGTATTTTLNSTRSTASSTSTSSTSTSPSTTATTGATPTDEDEQMKVDTELLAAIDGWKKAATCRSHATVVADIAKADGETDGVEAEQDDDLLTAEELKGYRALLTSAKGPRADHLLLTIKAHERAAAAKAATKPIDTLKLEGLEPAQALARIEERVASLQSQKADHAAYCKAKEEADEKAAEELLDKITKRIEAYKEQLQVVTTKRATERQKWQAVHRQKQEAFDAQLEVAKKKLAIAREDPNKVIKPSTETVKENVELEDVKMGDGLGAPQIRPLAVLPTFTTKDETLLTKLAQTQAVIDHWAQQDVLVELALTSLGLSPSEVIELVGKAEWDAAFPADSRQPQDDWPLPRRLISLVGKAISRIEVSTAAAVAAQATALEVLTQAAADTRAWKAVSAGRRPTPY